MNIYDSTVTMFVDRIFNTNNLWIKLPAMARVIEENTLRLEIIVNPKVGLVNFSGLLGKSGFLADP